MRTTLPAILRAAIALLAAGATAATATIAAAQNGAAPGPADVAMHDGVMRHLRALQDIATANGGNRAAGTPGYDRSADYVAARLKEAGYAVRFEAFEFPFFEERTPPALAVTAADGRRDEAPQAALRTLGYSGSGTVAARLQAINLKLDAEPPPASASGCEKSDFADFARGDIAFMRRGTCTFQIKVDNAVAAGAAGIVIMNEGTDGRKDTFSGQLSQAAAVPVVGVSYEYGRTLDAAARAGASVRIAIDAVTGKRPSRNVIGETGAVSEGPLIVVGAHLDSVPEGPGINDNGSGAAAVLEAAVELAPALRQAHVGMRFGFWGAEERGLIGSRHHVAALSDAERARIALYVNLDMVGSPNFARFVQGDAKDGAAGVARREIIGDFREHGLAVEERSGGRTGTDDASFNQKGVPTVGLYAGAGGKKSDTLAGLFGGTAGSPFDACYHRACDTIDNINAEALTQNTHALVRALGALAGEAR
jgi:Zn-dependent M28 family amino/carboxypeptidase